jgi:methanogenic corrinoid protein MtbC1
LKEQVDAGLSISRAVDYLNDLRTSDQNIFESDEPIHHELDAAINKVKADLSYGLYHYNEKIASQTFRRALSLYPIDQILEEIVKPIMIEIGEDWHNGEIPVALEHFTTQFFIQQILSMIVGSSPPTRPTTILAAGAPYETHQIGILSIVLLLRWRGWDVKYLGPNLSLDRLEEALSKLNPQLLLFTATREESAEALRELPQLISNLPLPHPQILVGGQGIHSITPLDAEMQIAVEGSLGDIINQIESLLNGKR